MTADLGPAATPRPIPTPEDRMRHASQPGPTFATYLDRHDRDQLDARAATAEAERDDALQDRDDARRERDAARRHLRTAEARIAELERHHTDLHNRLNALENDLRSQNRAVRELTAERDQARAALEQAQRQALTQASDLLWAWAEEMGDVGGTGPRAARKRTIKACARKIAPEPTDDEMRAALAELLTGMANRAKDDAAPSLGSPADRAQELPALVFNAISRALQDVWPISVPLPVVRERCAAAVLEALDGAVPAERAEG